MLEQDQATHRSELPRLLSQVAEASQVSVWSVRAEIRRGHLRTTRIGRLL